jgi:hypothetical protein
MVATVRSAQAVALASLVGMVWQVETQVSAPASVRVAVSAITLLMGRKHQTVLRVRTDGLLSMKVLKALTHAHHVLRGSI